MINEKKICFIICVNKEFFLQECLFYIGQLKVPEGFEIEVLSIRAADSMASGYNEGMNASDAKYKVYLHQDTFIVYKDFIPSILDIFASDESIGMIGMVGAPKIFPDGVMWNGLRAGSLYAIQDTKMDYKDYQYHIKDGISEVEAVDGLLIVTSRDIAWREDLFDGWDFYDVSQSFEFIRRGYRVVVPVQYNPWCDHMSGLMKLLHYDTYRKKCILEYPEFFHRDRFVPGKVEKKTEDGKICVVILARNEIGLVRQCIERMQECGVQESQIVVVDNGSEDGLHHWMRRQNNVNYLICNEMIEGYATILNKVIDTFVIREDLLIVTPKTLILPGCIEILKNVLDSDDKIGAVSAAEILAGSEEGKDLPTATEYALNNNSEKQRSVTVLLSEVILIKNALLNGKRTFKEELKLPENVMIEFCERKQEWKFAEAMGAFCLKYDVGFDVYRYRFGMESDRKVMQTTNERWATGNIACCIPTFNHPEVVQDVLSKSIELYRKYNIDLYYYDTSENDETKKVIESFMQDGFDNLNYIKLSSEIQIDEKTILIMQGYGLKRGYKYLWLMKDRSYPIQEAVERLVQNAFNDYDAIFFAGEHPNKKGLKSKSLYTCSEEFYLDCGWRATSMDVMVYNYSLFKNFIDWTEFRKNYFWNGQNHYDHFTAFFHSIAQKEKVAIKVLQDSTKFQIENSELGNSSVGKRLLEIWGRYWVAVNDALPECYQKNKDRVIKMATKLPWIIGDESHIKDLIQWEYINKENIQYVADIWQRISDVPFEKVEKWLEEF